MMRMRMVGVSVCGRRLAPLCRAPLGARRGRRRPRRRSSSALACRLRLPCLRRWRSPLFFGGFWWVDAPLRRPRRCPPAASVQLWPPPVGSSSRCFGAGVARGRGGLYPVVRSITLLEPRRAPPRTTRRWRRAGARYARPSIACLGVGSVDVVERAQRVGVNKNTTAARNARNNNAEHGERRHKGQRSSL